MPTDVAMRTTEVINAGLLLVERLFEKGEVVPAYYRPVGGNQPVDSLGLLQSLGFDIFAKGEDGMFYQVKMPAGWKYNARHQTYLAGDTARLRIEGTYSGGTHCLLVVL